MSLVWILDEVNQYFASRRGRAVNLAAQNVFINWLGVVEILTPQLIHKRFGNGKMDVGLSQLLSDQGDQNRGLEGIFELANLKIPSKPRF